MIDRRYRGIGKLFSKMIIHRSGIHRPRREKDAHGASYILRRSRYIGHAKTHLQHILIAIAISLARFVDWINQGPRAVTRTSAFAALAQV